MNINMNLGGNVKIITYDSSGIVDHRWWYYVEISGTRLGGLIVATQGGGFDMCLGYLLMMKGNSLFVAKIDNSDGWLAP